MSELDETTQQKYLEEMGITVWSSRALQAGDESGEEPAEKLVSVRVQEEVKVSPVPTVAGDSSDIPFPETLPVEAFADDFPPIPSEMDVSPETGVPVSSPATYSRRRRYLGRVTA